MFWSHAAPLNPRSRSRTASETFDQLAATRIKPAACADLFNQAKLALRPARHPQEFLDLGDPQILRQSEKRLMTFICISDA
jgi:hypothetical protein